MNYKEILKKNIPKNDPKIVIEPLTKTIETSLKELKIKAEVFLGGSVAKFTNLKDYDIDIFVRFDYKLYKPMGN